VESTAGHGSTAKPKGRLTGPYLNVTRLMEKKKQARIHFIATKITRALRQTASFTVRRDGRCMYRETRDAQGPTLAHGRPEIHHNADGGNFTPKVYCYPGARETKGVGVGMVDVRGRCDRPP